MSASAIDDTLAAAQIPRSKLGASRGLGLGDAERQLYLWILRGFAAEGPPRSADVQTETDRLGLDLPAALAALSREDLVHADERGEIVVAYPFSGRQSAHRVRFPGGHQAYAMCALDALGIAPMFEEPIEVESRDPLSGEEVHVQVAPDGTAAWSPQAAVVVTGAIRRGDDAWGGCCPVLNFFASRGNAERWLDAHPQVRGHPITLSEVAAAGKVIFGDVFAES